ncbi:MAG: hypothetical protein ACKO6N_07515 [Myxococcota bacterium]
MNYTAGTCAKGWARPHVELRSRAGDDLASRQQTQEAMQQKRLRIQQLRQQYLDGTLRFNEIEVARRMLMSLTSHL